MAQQGFRLEFRGEEVEAVDIKRSQLTKGTEIGREDAGMPLGTTYMETESDDVGGEAEN